MVGWLEVVGYVNHQYDDWFVEICIGAQYWLLYVERRFPMNCNRSLNGQPQSYLSPLLQVGWTPVGIL